MSEPVGTPDRPPYGSDAWWDSNPPLEQRMAYALETAPQTDSHDDGLMGWSDEIKALMAIFEEVNGRILPTGSLVGGMLNYDGLAGARKLYAIKPLEARAGRGEA